MAEIIGYSTIDRYKTYTVTDFEIIKQDLSNALNIRQGEMPGRPDVGTIMWSFIYEPQNAQTSQIYNVFVNVYVYELLYCT